MLLELLKSLSGAKYLARNRKKSRSAQRRARLNLLALEDRTVLSSVVVVGGLSNFDCTNNTGHTQNEFEIELPSVDPKQIAGFWANATYYKGSGYGLPSEFVAPSSDGIAGHVSTYVDYKASGISTPAGFTEHFGVHFANPWFMPPSTIYTWKNNGVAANVNMPSVSVTTSTNSTGGTTVTPVVTNNTAVPLVVRFHTAPVAPANPDGVQLGDLVDNNAEVQATEVEQEAGDNGLNGVRLDPGQVLGIDGEAHDPTDPIIVNPALWLQTHPGEGVSFGDDLNAPGESALATLVVTDTTGNPVAEIFSAINTQAPSAGRANATIVINPYSSTYDGLTHGLSGTATGANGENLAGQLNLGPTYVHAGHYRVTWTFTGGASYNDASGTADINIAKANATIAVTPYDVTYDGHAHTTIGSATGVLGQSLSGLNVGSTTHTNAGTYSDSWTFTDSTGNYNNASGTVSDVINKAAATITVTPYNVTYDGHAHTATGSATGVLGESLSGLNLSRTTHTNAGTFSDTWTFTDSTGNYNNASASVSDVVTPKLLGVKSEHTEHSLNIADEENLTFEFKVNKRGIVDGKSVASLFDGALFSLTVNGHTYGVQAAAKVEEEGEIQLTFRMTPELKAFLAGFTTATTAKKAPTVGLELKATSADGNYAIDTTVFTKVFSSAEDGRDDNGHSGGRHHRP